jgi:hypothetical protein
MTASKCLLLRLALAGFALTARAQNLVVNGGFEDGFTGWRGTFGYYNSPNTVDGSSVGILTDVTHSSVGMTLTQILPTEPGIAYDISFAVRLPELYQAAPGIWQPVVGDVRGGTAGIRLRWDDRTLLTVRPTSRDDWRYYTVRAIANDDSTTLNFFNSSPEAWPFIDGISVTRVPEPSGVFLAVLGATAVLWTQIRRPEARP